MERAEPARALDIPCTAHFRCNACPAGGADLKLKESVLLRGRKLLLADDSIAIQRVIELTFGDEGMEVVSVGDGQQAVERLAEVSPDIVLADIFMPALSGYQVCERIKRDERFRQTPVILLVGSFEPFDEAEARRVGADDYLTKPFQSIRQMVNKVGSLLGGHKDDASSQAAARTAEPSTAESHRGRMDELELTTADTAPLPQVIRPADEEHEGKPAAEPFADLQMDDEMIEATPASEFGSTTSTTASLSRPNAPLAMQEPLEMQEPPKAEVETAMATTTNTPGQQVFEESAQEVLSTEVLSDEWHEPAAVAEPAVTAHAANSNGRAAESDDVLLDLDEEVELPRAGARAAADDFILDLQDETEAQAQVAPSNEMVLPAFESESGHGIEGGDLLGADPPGILSGAGPQAMEFAEGRMQGEEGGSESGSMEGMLAGVDTGSSQQGGTLSVPTEKLPEGYMTAETPVPSGPSATGGQIDPSQLSPEVIDQIARRVVEHLSTKVIEQIAWEVVPELAELIIKRRLEEEGSKPH